ncbi:MAG TPA: universal stress protein [Solirubrobacteraceae bacterium]|nr:universal stress protein [Solirubrobacteraceae bacterium]
MTLLITVRPPGVRSPLEVLPVQPNGGPGSAGARSSPKAIISYDGTPNDQDALMLGRVLAGVGARLELAYVRHSTQSERSREELEEHEADELLARGARMLGVPDVPRRVVVSGSTADGLRRLAAQEAADILVFGSDYRTAAGHVAPQRSAQTLLDGGPVALALAPASYGGDQAGRWGRVGLLAAPEDMGALATAHDLASGLGAVVRCSEPHVDLLVLGSRPEASPGRVMISSRAQNELENAMSPVLVLPRGVSIRFPAGLAG